MFTYLRPLVGEDFSLQREPSSSSNEGIPHGKSEIEIHCHRADLAPSRPPASADIWPPVRARGRPSGVRPAGRRKRPGHQPLRLSACRARARVSLGRCELHAPPHTVSRQPARPLARLHLHPKSCHCQYVAANCKLLARRTTCGSAGAPTTTPISRRPLSACMHGHGLSVAKVMRDP